MITRHGISIGNFVVNVDWKELIAGNQQFLTTGIKNEIFFLLLFGPENNFSPERS